MKRQPTRLPDGEKDFAFRFGYQSDNDDVQQSILDILKGTDYEQLPKEQHLVELCVYLRRLKPTSNEIASSRKTVTSSIDAVLASINKSWTEDDDENTDSKPAAVIDDIAADKLDNNKDNDNNNNSSSSSSSNDDDIDKRSGGYEDGVSTLVEDKDAATKDNSHQNIQAVRNYIHEHLFASHFEAFFAHTTKHKGVIINGE